MVWREPYLRKSRRDEVHADEDDGGDANGDSAIFVSVNQPGASPGARSPASAEKNLIGSHNSPQSLPQSQPQPQPQTAVSLLGQSTFFDQLPAFNCEGLTPFIAGFEDSLADGTLGAVDAFSWTAADSFLLNDAVVADVDRTARSRGLDPSSMTPLSGITLVSWRRPHGSTAITPGLKRIKLRVRLADPSNSCQHKHCDCQGSPSHNGSNDNGASTVGDDSHTRADRHSLSGIGNESLSSNSPGTARSEALPHLINLFDAHLFSMFPFLDVDTLLHQYETSNGPSFLLDSIAAASARFSVHPSVALADLKPPEYSKFFCDRAKSMIGSMLSVPSQTTVVALSLLALVGVGNDSESEVWMFMGMAIRMSQDLGLHLDSSSDPQVNPEDRRRDRLLFWSVFILDCALSFGVGRKLCTDLESITQPLPTLSDIRPSSSEQFPSPFPATASLFLKFAPIINELNGSGVAITTRCLNSKITKMMDIFVAEYIQLPPSLEWSVSNMRGHSQAGNSCAFVWLHLWFHSVLASMDCQRPLSNGAKSQPSSCDSGQGISLSEPRSQQITGPDGTTVAHMWPHDAARSVCDIVSIANMMDFPSYCSTPLLNQPLFIVGSFYVSQIEQAACGRAAGNDSSAATSELSTSERFTIQKSKSSIAILRSALQNQATYWGGVRWILGSLDQRIQGSLPGEVDLEKITESSPNSVTLPDQGLLRSIAQGFQATTTA